MEASSVKTYIQDWLNENHAPAVQRDVLHKVMAVGKTSHSWVAAIQRYIKEKTMQVPGRGEVKTACRTILEDLPQ